MKKILIFLTLFLLLIPIGAGYKGVVMNETDIVKYKFDTNTFPKLEKGEHIKLTDSINDINAGAEYIPATGIFINPEPIIYEEINLEVKRDPFNPTQTIISGLTGAGTAYFMVRRLKTKGA